MIFQALALIALGNKAVTGPAPRHVHPQYVPKAPMANTTVWNINGTGPVLDFGLRVSQMELSPN